MIELRHISKDFGTGKHAVHAVQDVSLTVETGEIPRSTQDIYYHFDFPLSTTFFYFCKYFFTIY